MSDPIVPPATADELRRADRYVAGELSSAEREALEQQLSTDPRWAGLRDLRDEFAIRAARPIPDIAIARARLAPRLREAAADTRPGTHRISRSRQHIIGFAGGLASLLVVGIISVARMSSATHDMESAQIYRTPAARRATITFPNGSRVTLGPATTLRVTRKESEIVGEALFDIPHHDGASYTVRAGSTITRVLGTRFTVRAYDTDRFARVVVGAGRISFAQAQGTPVVLDAGMMAQATDSGTVLVSRDARLTDFTGQLTFKDAPLRDVLADVSRAYGVELQVNDPALAARRLTFTASVTTESLTEMLDFFAQALDAHYTRSGRTVIFAAGLHTSTRNRALPLTLEKQYGR